jgi:hypothetical protein
MPTESETIAAEKMRRKRIVAILANARIADSQSKLDRNFFSQITAFSMRFASMIPRTLSVCVNSDRIRGGKTNSDVDSKTVCNAGKFRSMKILFSFLIAQATPLASAFAALRRTLSPGFADISPLVPSLLSSPLLRSRIPI